MVKEYVRGANALNNWLDFYYSGAESVTPSQIRKSLEGVYSPQFRSGYTRGKRELADNERIRSWAKRTGKDIENPEVARAINKEIDKMLEKAKKTGIKGSEELVKSVALPRSGFNIKDRPVFLWKGQDENVAVDESTMLIGHGAREFLKKQTEKMKRPSDVGTFPQYTQLIPEKGKRFGRELHVAGTSFSEVGKAILWLTDKQGENAINVDADKFAWLRSFLPKAKIYGSAQSIHDMKIDQYGESVMDAVGHTVWKAQYFPERLSPTSPLVFVVDGKDAGVLMPVFPLKDVPDGLGIKSSAIRAEPAKQDKYCSKSFGAHVRGLRRYAKLRSRPTDAIIAVKERYKEIFDGFSSLDEAKKAVTATDTETKKSDTVYAPDGRWIDRDMLEDAIRRAEKHPELTPFSLEAAKEATIPPATEHKNPNFMTDKERIASKADFSGTENFLQ